MGLLLGLFFLFFSAACSQTDNEQSVNTIRVAVLPDDGMKNRFDILINYLSHETGVIFQKVWVKDYQQTLDKFNNKEADLVLFGGYTFVKAFKKGKGSAEPLVMRDVDTRFLSYYLVKAESKAKLISDLKGKVISFGPPLSTSGHLMPRYFLEKQYKIIPEHFFSEVKYSISHSQTIERVLHGQADVGVVNFLIFNKLSKSGKIGSRQLRILDKTPPYSNYVWTVQKTMPQRLKDVLIEAFTKLSLDKPEYRKILKITGGKAYFPSNPDDFSELEHAIHHCETILEKIKSDANIK